MQDQTGYCDKCGHTLDVGQRFCGQCGSELPIAPGAAADSALEEGLDSPGLVWEANVHLLSNPVVLRQMVNLLGFTWLITFGLVALLLAVEGEWHGIPGVLVAGLLVVGALGLVAVLIMLLFGTHRYRFTVNGEGVLVEVVDRRVKAATWLALLLGLLGGRASATGAAMIARSREVESYRWRGITRASYHPLWRGITLHDAWRTVAFLACTPGNYEQVAAYVRRMVTSAEARRSAPARSPLPRLLGRSALVVLASLPVFLLPHPFELDLLLPLLMLCFALATVWLVPFFGWVVIAAALWIAGEVVLIGLQVRQFTIARLGVYRVYEILDTEEWFALALAATGLAYLISFSWRAVRGRILPALIDHGTATDDRTRQGRRRNSKKPRPR